MSESKCPKCGALNRKTARFCAECGTLLVGDSAPASAESSENQREAPALAEGSFLQRRYRIENELGRGGFGAVYRAWDNNLSRACAVKENLDTSPEAQRQFAREATVLANLSHPNLPRVTDHFVIPGQGQYLVMDFVEGHDLASLAKQGSGLSVEQASERILQVLDALEYLHGLEPPVLHRDIKPANIRITPKGRAMLVDFGLVKLFDPHLKTTVGARAITPGYAPPEQYGQGRTDVRSDIYALGATLYKLLTGREPLESVQRMSGEPMPAVQTLNPEVPWAIGEVVEHAMALEPSKRFQSAKEFKAALKAALAGQKREVAGEVVATVAVEPVPEVSPSVSTSAAEKRPRGTQVVDVDQGPKDRPGGVARTVAMSEQVAAGRSASAPAIEAAAAARKGGAGKLAIAVVAVIVLFCLGGVIGLGAYFYSSQQKAAQSTSTAQQVTQVAQANATSTMQAQTTATQGAMLTSTAGVQATATAGLQATNAAKVMMTATAQAGVAATEQARVDYVNSLLAKQQLVYGPASGSMFHDDDEYIEEAAASVNLRDFVVEVRLYNPYSPDRGAWDYGIMFRSNADEANQQYRLIISSDKTWRISNHTGSGSGATVAEGSVSGLSTSAGGSNLIRFVCEGNQGWLYVNSVFIAEIDLSSRMDAGDVVVGTGFFSDTEIPGETTQYQDFTVWSLP